MAGDNSFGHAHRPSLTSEIVNLNTPKTANIKSLFRDAIGLPNVPSAWY
jgi:hypothetical protein